MQHPVSMLFSMLLAWSDVPLAAFDGTAGTARQWITVNDPVMGGGSDSSFSVVREERIGRWAGEVKIVRSLGAPGFCTARTAGDALFRNVTGSTHLGLSLKGGSGLPAADFSLQVGVKGVTTMQTLYQAQLGGEYCCADDCRVPWSAFRPSFRGRPIKGPPLADNLGALSQLGLGTAGTAGRFSLDISSLYATRDASRPRGCARDEPARAPPGAEAAEEASPHMNAGLAYHVANALPGHELSPRGFARTSEHFTLYSPPIRSRYAGVVWRVLPPVPLPVEVVQRYNGSAMAVTGFEVDVVRRPAGGDVSVPNYQSYNHHYTAHLLGAGMRLPASAVGTPNLAHPNRLPLERVPLSAALPAAAVGLYSSSPTPTPGPYLGIALVRARRRPLRRR
mmetsp:Transcript_51468/g.166011  ORF Transcript_51468/g.166011 Transcript_51468/m.166011 type:complete len:393 (+) Transcript_51468:105-1283(+)